MNIQCSKGDRSPNVNGNNNTTGVGDNNKQKVSHSNSVNVKKASKYTAIGILVAILLSFIGSYLANKCSGNITPNTQKKTELVSDSLQ